MDKKLGFAPVCIPICLIRKVLEYLKVIEYYVIFPKDFFILLILSISKSTLTTISIVKVYWLSQAFRLLTNLLYSQTYVSFDTKSGLSIQSQSCNSSQNKGLDKAE